MYFMKYVLTAVYMEKSVHSICIILPELFEPLHSEQTTHLRRSSWLVGVEATLAVEIINVTHWRLMGHLHKNPFLIPQSGIALLMFSPWNMHNISSRDMYILYYRRAQTLAVENWQIKLLPKTWVDWLLCMSAN